MTLGHLIAVLGENLLFASVLGAIVGAVVAGCSR